MMSFEEYMTRENVRGIFNYDLNTGALTWKKCHKKSLAGQAAGSVNSRGYITVSTAAGTIAAHRIIFMYVLGWLPEMVDHINMSKTDNRWINLRAATRSQNFHNTPARKHAKYKKGVSKKNGRYRAQIQVDKKKMHLGTFDTEDEAHNEYLKAAEKYIGDFTHGRSNQGA